MFCCKAYEANTKTLARELQVLNTKPRQPKPDWLRIRLGDPTNQNHLLKLIEGLEPAHGLSGSTLPEHL